MRRSAWGVALALVGSGLFLAPARAAAPPPPPALDASYDNSSTADLDGAGNHLPAAALAAAGWLPGRAPTVHGARLAWPPLRPPGSPDNVRAAGQTVRAEGHGGALAFLVTSTGGGTAGGRGSVTYADGTHSPFALAAPDWRTGPLATRALALPYLGTPSGPVAERPRLYVVTVPLARGREVVSVRLPRAPRLHVFALAVRPAPADWTGTWAAAPSALAAVGPWTDRTLRLVVHTSAGGPRVRLRFDNAFAPVPVRIGAATVAVRSAGAAPRSAPVPLSFDGAPGIAVPAGAQAVSDPLPFAVPADTDLLVSFHLPGTVTSLPWHGLAVQRSYLSGPGDHTADADGTAYPATIGTWPLLTGVDVGGGPGAVVVLGDSITDGDRSTVGANRRWPDALAARLRRQDALPRYGVLNAGIASNRVAADRYPGDGIARVGGGVAAPHRLDRDVLAQTAVRTLVVFEGVNDLRDGTAAAEVAAGLREIAGRARAHGLRVLGATLPPCGGSALCTPAVEAERAALNAWIRTTGAFHAVLDLDRALRDPAAPERMLTAYDSGDHLHPGDAGYAALAEAVDLRLL